jgi:hypothetical protein
LPGFSFYCRSPSFFLEAPRLQGKHALPWAFLNPMSTQIGQPPGAGFYSI